MAEAKVDARVAPAVPVINSVPVSVGLALSTIEPVPVTLLESITPP